MTGTLINSVKTLQKGLTLLTAETPNGIKPLIFLHLLGVDYNVKKIDISGENKEDWFVNFNPNSKIPTLLEVCEGGKVQKSIPESLAILYYLADTYDKENKYHYPLGDPKHYEELTWCSFQIASLGPMQGQAGHFGRFAKEDIPYAKKRYNDEVARLYEVLEYQIKRTGSGYIVGDKLGLADILIWPWAHFASYANVNLDDHPYTKKWHDSLEKLDAFTVGAKLPKADE